MIVLIQHDVIDVIGLLRDFKVHLIKNRLFYSPLFNQYENLDAYSGRIELQFSIKFI